MKTNRQQDPCSHCDLSHHCFSVNVNGDSTNAINEIVQDSLILKKGETLYHQEEKFRGLFAVKSGAIKTFVVNEDGDELTTGFYLPSELLGFDAIYSEHYIENASALTNTEVCRIPFHALLQLAQKNHFFQKELFKIFSYRLNQNKRQFHYNAEQKIAHFLLEYSHRLMKQNHDGLNFQLWVTQQDIASYLGLTPETISRTFHKFLLAEIFTSNKAKHIANLDHAKLQSILQAEPEQL